MLFFSRILFRKDKAQPQAVESSDSSSLAEKIRDLGLDSLGLCPGSIDIPRAACHRLTLSLKGVPKHLRTSSIRLQLLNITGLQTFGFAWKMANDDAEIWYWDESSLTYNSVARSSASNVGSRPMPEMLHRKMPKDGLHLLACRDGFEALAIDNGQLLRTRWFAQIPTTTAWQGFVRDAGKKPNLHPLPEVASPRLAEKPDAGWKIETTLLHKIQPATWATLALTLMAGLTIAILLTYDLKVSYLIDRQQEALAKLKVEKAVILELHQQIAENTQLPELISNARPKILQLRLMRALADTGLFDTETKISLLEWEYRNERLRLMFSVPKENFSLGLFLSTLEGSHIFQDIRLMPDTPPQTIGIQASVRELPSVSTYAYDEEVGGEPLKEKAR